MAGRGHVVIGIAELGDVCVREWAVALGWFETLGQWVLDEPDPARQRLWATAGHRHAWHAELWADRRPRIPPESVPETPAAVAPRIDGDRSTAYRAALSAWRDDLAAVREAIDPELDPATQRVISLVDTDLAELTQLLDRLP